ncbi:uncharacterized protein LOC62_03G004580 [Vanrija pseudolonga]|uniref:Uncharacterized protein n=1 Tax=Vanrija pseudolonga TaxID=143232 RepID=A0AAF0Y6X0_9TREE|nr:hypothetical protein LOC62_03G004580 [Vanrija pseudolonga]
MLEALTSTLPGRYFTGMTTNGGGPSHTDAEDNFFLEYDLTQEAPPGQSSSSPHEEEQGGSQQRASQHSGHSLLASQHSASTVAAAAMLTQLGYGYEHEHEGGHTEADYHAAAAAAAHESDSSASNALAVPEEAEEEEEDDFDYVADADKFDVGTELVQRWDALQAQLEAAIKDYSDGVIREAYTTTLQVTKMLGRMNDECHAELERGVALIQAEEGKHDAAIARMRSAMDLMERACKALDGK